MPRRKKVVFEPPTVPDYDSFIRIEDSLDETYTDPEVDLDGIPMENLLEEGSLEHAKRIHITEKPVKDYSSLHKDSSYLIPEQPAIPNIAINTISNKTEEQEEKEDEPSRPILPAELIVDELPPQTQTQDVSDTCPLCGGNVAVYKRDLQTDDMSYEYRRFVCKECGIQLFDILLLADAEKSVAVRHKVAKHMWSVVRKNYAAISGTSAVYGRLRRVEMALAEVISLSENFIRKYIDLLTVESDIIGLDRFGNFSASAKRCLAECTNAEIRLMSTLDRHRFLLDLSKQ